MKIFLLLFGLLLLGNELFAQTINNQFIDGEIYLKVKNNLPNGIASTNAVNINAELPFLAKYSTLFSFTEAKKLFTPLARPNYKKFTDLSSKSLKLSIWLLKN